MTVLISIVGAFLVLFVLLLGGLAIFSARTARRVEKLLPARGRFIDVDGERIHYLDEGSGPPLVLIHGLAGQIRVFTHSLLDHPKEPSPRHHSGPAGLRVFEPIAESLGGG